MLDPHLTVANVVLDHSECAEVFQRHRIDFCCRGGLTLEEAARARHLDLGVLVRELDEAIASRRGETPVNLRALSTPQLVAHILLNHHDPLCRAMPLVLTLAAKVSRVHGEHNPKLRELEAAVKELEATLTPHLEEEVRSVFPLLSGQTPEREAVQTMLKDHQTVMRLVEHVRCAADEYVLPGWACTSYRTLFSELKALEIQVLTRLHLENQLLLPRIASA